MTCACKSVTDKGREVAKLCAAHEAEYTARHEACAAERAEKRAELT